MAIYELLLPKMGESVAEATVIKWNKQVGDRVDVEDSVLEIATDKVDSEVPSPVQGTLVKQLFEENQVAQVGDVVALIETAEEQQKQLAVAEEASEDLAENSEQSPVEDIPYVPQKEEAQEEPVKTSFNSSERFYSPLVKSIAQEEGISISELDEINGSGTDGRVTKDDLLAYISNKKQKDFAGTATPEQETGAPVVNTATETAPKPAPVEVPALKDEIVEMDRMRKMISEHMIHSKEVAAHVTSFVEADVTNLVLWRDKVKASFEKREGEKITFTPVFVEAVTKAIKDMPMINISLNGHQIIKKKDINIGMAAALPNGNLIVPVIKNADQLNLVGLTKAVNDLAKRARENRLQPEEIKGGTFTLTNIGGFGNIMGTPIINQPQVAILAVGAIKKKPAVLETAYGDVIAIRHMMYLSLSYDHRIVDGALGGMFVKRVADYLEAWDVNREI